MPAAKNHKNLALLFYLWNGAICEAFYLPMHHTEISRNVLQQALVAQCGSSLTIRPGWRSKTSC
jgi:hypothetical protein